jgi:hypothetical protein
VKDVTSRKILDASCFASAGSIVVLGILAIIFHFSIFYLAIPLAFPTLSVMFIFSYAWWTST